MCPPLVISLPGGPARPSGRHRTHKWHYTTSAVGQQPALAVPAAGASTASWPPPHGCPGGATHRPSSRPSRHTWNTLRGASARASYCWYHCRRRPASGWRGPLTARIVAGTGAAVVSWLTSCCVSGREDAAPGLPSRQPAPGTQTAGARRSA